MINPFLGKRVTAISVFEPWLEPGLVPNLPLFGAIAFEFEDVALFFRSPLRYQFGNPKRLPKHAPSKSCLPMRCDLEQLEWHKGLLSELGMARRLPGWVAIRPARLEVTYPVLASLLGAEFASYGFLSRQIFELCFVGQESMLVTYREDLGRCVAAGSNRLASHDPRNHRARAGVYLWLAARSGAIPNPCRWTALA